MFEDVMVLCLQRRREVFIHDCLPEAFLPSQPLKASKKILKDYYFPIDQY